MNSAQIVDAEVSSHSFDSDLSKQPLEVLGSPSNHTDVGMNPLVAAPSRRDVSQLQPKLTAGA